MANKLSDISQVNDRVVTATKWSAVTEIMAKLVSPISTMILARLLTPDAFGVLVTAMMVISFAEIFTDAGFQKYIIQHAFKDDDDLCASSTVAFWSNLLLSFVIWGVIALFSPQLAHLVGNDGYGLVIAVSCACIPLSAFYSIQLALFKRKLDFKTLFIVRVVGLLIPLVVTIPLAVITRSYWSLIIGLIAFKLCNAIILTWKSSWKPKRFYDIKLFKEMFSFSIWSMVESVTIWLAAYLDIFVVGAYLDSYFMGVYRTAITTVGQIMGIVTSVTTPVLFSALSLLQDDDGEFKRLFFKFQKMVALLIIPMGVGIYLFRDLITDVLLGDQWGDASYLIGWWGLTSAVTIVLSHFCGEVYRAKGEPKYTVVAQLVHICFLVPTLLVSIRYGFESLCLWRSLVRFTLIGINLYLLYKLVRISPLDMISNIIHICMATAIMFAFHRMMPADGGILTQCLYIFLCVIIYFIVICVFKSEREIVFNFKSLIKR